MTTLVPSEPEIKKRKSYTELSPPPLPKQVFKVTTSSDIKNPVIMCSGITSDFISRISEFCKLLGTGKVVSKYSKHVTHLVTKSHTSKNLCGRTLKYLQSVITGCWIVDFNCMWFICVNRFHFIIIIQPNSCKIGIEQSKNQKKWLAEESFEIYGDLVSEASSVKNARENAAAKVCAHFTDGLIFARY
jgi:hypothetical protein